MSNIFELYGICTFTSILVFFFLSTRLCFIPRRHPVQQHHTPAGVLHLLDPPTVSKDVLLRSRAAPNARLLTAFHLTNTFVSPDPVINTEFVKKSSALLRTAEKDWRGFSGLAVQSVDLALPDHTTPFHKFVRSVTLRTIIVGLLDPTADITYLAAHDIDIVADLINDIWLLSKKLEPIPEHLLEMLNTHLRRLVPDQDMFPNPLDFVIPAWETLWRVVSVTLAQVHMDAEACRAFHDLFDDVSMKQFRAKRLDDTAPSTEDYIIESLRLYPPVKHITRHMFRPRALTRFLPRFLAALIPSRFDIEIADIESAQRSACWGSHTTDFDPTRFLDKPELTKELLAFGCGLLACKATRWAPMAAAVIVAAILSRVDGVHYHFVRGAHVGGGREGWEGWEVRKVRKMDVDT